MTTDIFSRIARLNLQIGIYLSFWILFQNIWEFVSVVNLRSCQLRDLELKINLVEQVFDACCQLMHGLGGHLCHTSCLFTIKISLWPRRLNAIQTLFQLTFRSSIGSFENRKLYDERKQPMTFFSFESRLKVDNWKWTNERRQFVKYSNI